MAFSRTIRTTSLVALTAAVLFGSQRASAQEADIVDIAVDAGRGFEQELFVLVYWQRGFESRGSAGTVHRLHTIKEPRMSAQSRVILVGFDDTVLESQTSQAGWPACDILRFGTGSEAVEHVRADASAVVMVAQAGLSDMTGLEALSRVADGCHLGGGAEGSDPDPAFGADSRSPCPG